jgi:predicted ATPase/DNA-binding CsgD family transcriptional regulator
MQLPGILTSFIGREREVAEVGQLLRQAHLVTLTGAGGVGKTRLALAVADEIGETFAGGVAVVDLAPVLDPGAVPAATARALGIRDDGDLPIEERLANALRDRAALLILDNFEQVLTAAPWLLGLLQAAPQVKALVTSRAPLRVRGEREFAVAPLACPGTTENETIDALLGFPALALFLERAQEVRPDFVLAPANAASVAEICRRVDGLPLALELAAARIRILSPEALLSRLGQGIALLSGGPRDLPARQQTLHATIAWSYQLLRDDEQALFRRLAVFAGDFSLEAALAVARLASAQPGDHGNSGADNVTSDFDRLTSLVEKGLLGRVDNPDGEPRFRMLETVRVFAGEQLVASGEVDAIRQAHAAFFVALVEAAAPHLRRAQRASWLRRVEAEMPNLRAVVAWSSTGTDDGNALVRLVNALSFAYWRIGGYLHEAWRWYELARSMPMAQPPTADRARLLFASGALAAWLQRLEPARVWLEESVNLARVLDDRALLGSALVFLGYAETLLAKPEAVQHLQTGLAALRAAGDRDDLVLGLNVALAPLVDLNELAAAHRTLTECLEIARELADEWGIAVALSSAGYLDLRERNWSAAQTHIEQALTIHRRLGDEGSVAILLNNLAHVARHRGDDLGAVGLLEQSLALSRRLGHPAGVTLYNLGDWALRRGEIPRATAYLAEALREGARSGELRSIVVSAGGLARLAVAVGQPEVAARLIGTINAVSQQTHLNLSLEFQSELERAANVARARLGEATFRAMETSGAVAPLAQVTAEAVAWVDALQPPEPSDPPRVLVQSNLPLPPVGLSPREMDVLRLIAVGKSNREIADALVISLNTVARHVSNIFDKVGAANRTEAAAFAHHHGLAP